jgi:hypothetical protein
VGGVYQPSCRTGEGGNWGAERGDDGEGWGVYCDCFGSGDCDVVLGCDQ